MESPTPANPNNVQRQLAIFDVVRRARGKSLPQIKAMLTKAFTERGLSRQPGAWLDAVASEAAYGKPYIVDLPAAVAANSIAAAPDPQVEDDLRKRGILRRSENSTGSQHPSPAATKTTDEGEESGHPATPAAEARNKRDAAHPRRASDTSTRTVLRLIASALLIASAATAVGVALRQRRRRPTSPDLAVGACTVNNLEAHTDAHEGRWRNPRVREGR
ncbi:hypothetical protein GCM10023346_05140 [Arthrobacter gyeryongensis]|uniref:Uncharacterized protein n=1 Tax=Arthrobacter gyeryongensis TaxID=1650592 RepID=A0ABP9S0A5_9MICC